VHITLFRGLFKCIFLNSYSIHRIRERSEVMPYCPKCGNKVEENMTFCPRCGAPLKMEAQAAQAPSAPPAPPQPPMRNEKQEKGEKKEKQEPEKREKHEKGEFGYIGFLIGGLVVIVLGVIAFLRVSGTIVGAWEGPLTLLVIGLAIIVVGVYVAILAKRRNPQAA
jgi:heme/copper-type cytochrome/quinol oxidase subunit 4